MAVAAVVAAAAMVAAEVVGGYGGGGGGGGYGDPRSRLTAVLGRAWSDSTELALDAVAYIAAMPVGTLPSGRGERSAAAHFRVRGADSSCRCLSHLVPNLSR